MFFNPIYRFVLVSFFIPVVFLFSSPAFSKITDKINSAKNYRIDGDSKALVGAYYFGVFNSGFRTAYQGYISNWPLDVQKRPQLWWYGVEDLYLKQGSAYNDLVRLYPDYETNHLKPDIGFHDNSQISVLEKHIDQAADGGLDYFNFYWYWSKSKKSESIQESLYAFKKASNKSKLKFHLSLYFHPWDPDHQLSANDAAIAVSQIIEHVKDPQYLKLDGRPVITIGDGRGNKNGKLSDLQDLMGYIRVRFLSAQVGNPLILVQPGAVEGWNLSNPDGYQCLVPSPELIVHNGNYNTFVDSNQNYFDSLQKLGLPFSPCVASGFDERPRYNVFIYSILDLRFLKNFSMKSFDVSLTAARKSSESQTSQIGKLINIYAWNEWHEGGIIEPSEKNGTLLLEAIEANFKTRSLNLFEKSNGVKIASVQSSIKDFKLKKSWKLFSEFRADQIEKRALYECKITGNNSPTTFLSIDANCEGQTNVFGTSPIGYVLNSNANRKLNLKPLYRCNAFGSFHFVSDQLNCESQKRSPTINEGLLGFVPAGFQ